jgi:hypothetical protein
MTEDTISQKLDEAYRQAVGALTCLISVARSPFVSEVVVLDSEGAATDIKLALDAYEHLWPSVSQRAGVTVKQEDL